YEGHHGENPRLKITHVPLMKEHRWPFHQWSPLRFQSRCQFPEPRAKTFFCQSGRRWFFPLRGLFAFRRLFPFRRLFVFRRLFRLRNWVPVFCWFHTRATAGFLRLANGATRSRCCRGSRVGCKPLARGIVATVYGPERVNEPRLE